LVPRFGKKKRDRYITDDEYTRLIEAASPTLRVIINVPYLTSQRIGDVLKIKQSDISPDGITFIQEKTGKKTLARISHQDHGRITLTYLPGQINGKIRSHKGVRDLLHGYDDKAGLDDIHLQDLRAKAITDAKKQGHDPQALAGHTTEAQTVRYLRDKEIPLLYGPKFKQ
jgi:integrase